MNHRLVFAFVALALAACSPAPTTAPGAPAGGGAPATQSRDATFLAKAAMFETYEIQAAELAASQASRQTIKDYAAASGTEHRATLQRLNELAAANHMAAPPTDLDDNFTAYLDMLRRANGESFDTLYQSQQALAYINASGFYQAYADTAPDSALKAWAAEQAPHLQQGVTAARQLSQAN